MKTSTHNNIYSEFKSGMNCSSQIESVSFISYILSEKFVAFLLPFVQMLEQKSRIRAISYQFNKVHKTVMRCYLKIILTTMLIGRIHLSSRDSCKTSTHFQLLAENSRADVPVIFSDFAQFFSMCAHLCLAHKLCTSFNYNDATMDCEILSYNHISSETKRLIHSPGWKFYQKAIAKVFVSFLSIRAVLCIDSRQ